MKSKILSGLLIITSLLGFLQWGKNQELFLFQAEAEIITKLFTDTMSVIHPFTLLPLMGQLLLLFTLFQNPPSKKLTYVSIGALGLLLGFMFIIGILSLNYKILLSVIPFWITAIMTIRHHRKIKSME